MPVCVCVCRLNPSGLGRSAYVFFCSCVKEAGRRMYGDEVSKMSKEYLPMAGSPDFIRLSQDLIFGKISKALSENRLASVQTLSGTGALCILGHFLRAYLPAGTLIYSSKPSWANHAGVFEELLGFEFREYAYWDAVTCARTPFLLHMRVCIYVCMYPCVYVSMYVCVYVHV